VKEVGKAANVREQDETSRTSQAYDCGHVMRTTNKIVASRPLDMPIALVSFSMTEASTLRAGEVHYRWIFAKQVLASSIS
jgi:hypothetical protein